MKKLAAILLVLSAFAGRSAYASNTATATAGLTLVNAITISLMSNLNFGYVVPGGTSGTVVIAPQLTLIRSSAGGVVLGNAGSAGAARFWASGGPAGSTFSITLPGSITITDGTNNMTVNTFTSLPVSTSTLPNDVYVGATLQVGANQAFLGPFTGSFNVTVNYN